MIKKQIDIEEVKAFIRSQSEATKIYVGGDSERFKVGAFWYADYINVVVVHINGNRGCRVFGQVVRERDYDQKKDKPRMRLMNEVIKTAQLYLDLGDIIDEYETEIHLDLNTDEKHGSSCVVKEAVGYIQSMCNVVPMVKPDAWSASYCADRFKDAIQDARKVI